MDGERWERIQALFLEALDLNPTERAAFLDETCAGDPSLRDEVEGLLASEDHAQSGFIRPPSGTGLEPGDLPTVGEVEAVAVALPSIDGYEILEVLGEGGMGIVYLAEQTRSIHRRVALKVIKGGMDSHQIVGRFAAERQALAVMNHPHIARVYDAGTANDGRPYFVMEYVDGAVPLTTYCDTHRLPLEARLKLFIKVCEAVHHAHQRAVIHRDIKPSNVLVAEEDGVPSPKIIDFGIAKALDPSGATESLMTETGQLVGTPSYMSPEQTDVENLGLDTRTDVYSLGALLYELLVGAAPLDPAELGGQSLYDLIVSIREREPKTPSLRFAALGASAPEAAAARGGAKEPLERQLRGDLDWITMKALEKDRTRRYSSAVELAEDLRRHLRHEPVLARPPSVTYRLGRFARRYRLQVASVTVLLMVAMIAVAVEWNSARLASESARREGRSKLDRSLTLSTEAKALYREWERIRRDSDSWLPVWERDAELDLFARARSQEAKGKSAYLSALQSLNRARDSAPPFVSLRETTRALEDLYLYGHREAVEYGSTRFPPEFFRGMVEGLGVGTYAEELVGDGTLQIETHPDGADVFCFRYESYDEALLPIPFHPELPPRQPFLLIERVAEGHEPLRAGDRVLQVVPPDGQARETTTIGDLARASRTSWGERFVVVVQRDGERRRLEWMPTLSTGKEGKLSPEQLVDSWEQLGFLPAGYPLEFLPEYRLGVTDGSAPLSVRLPRGSYLLVLRGEGLTTTRFPVSIPEDAGTVALSLPSRDSIPPGYVYVPPGISRHGARTEEPAYEPFPRAEASVGGFAIARHEVTLGDYLEFLNAPETRARERKPQDRVPWKIVEPQVSWDRPELRAITERAGKRLAGVVLEPWYGRYKPLLEATGPDGDFEIGEDFPDLQLDMPVLGVSYLAALEYARWLTERSGGKWRFRLPTDLEWERASRGVDRRRYVWGDYPLYARAGCRLGTIKARIEPVGMHPFDESVFGVRDLSGSLSEPVLTPTARNVPKRASLFVPARGANWETTDPRDVHLASRNFFVSDLHIRWVGIRLVAGWGGKP